MRIDLEQVKKRIADIPPQERRALILRDVLDFKYKEIAQILNVEVNSVGVYIHRARSLVFAPDESDGCWRWRLRQCHLTRVWSWKPG